MNLRVAALDAVQRHSKSTSAKLRLHFTSIMRIILFMEGARVAFAWPPAQTADTLADAAASAYINSNPEGSAAANSPEQVTTPEP